MQQVVIHQSVGKNNCCYVFQHNRSLRDFSDLEPYVTALNILHSGSDSEQINAWLQQHKKNVAAVSPVTAQGITSVLQSTPELFVDDLSYTRESPTKALLKEFLARDYAELRPKPSTVTNSGHSNPNGGNHLSRRHALAINKTGALLIGGDPRQRSKSGEEIVLFRGKAPEGFYSTIEYADYNPANNLWHTIDLPVENFSLPAKMSEEQYNATLKNIANGEVVIPHLEYSQITELGGTDVALTPYSVKPVYDNPQSGINLDYSFKIANKLPRAIAPSSQLELAKFSAQSLPPELSASLGKLPKNLADFMSQISILSPLKQLVLVEAWVKENSVYDYDFAEVSDSIAELSPSEQFAMLAERAISLELRGTNQEFKSFAGVCVNFAMLGCAALRQLGFAASIATGYQHDGSGKLGIEHQHAVVSVYLPTTENKLVKLSIDFTPGSPLSLEYLLDNLEDAEKLAQDLQQDQLFAELLSEEQKSALEAACQAHLSINLRENSLFRTEGLESEGLRKVVNVLSGIVEPNTNTRKAWMAEFAKWYWPEQISSTAFNYSEQDFEKSVQYLSYLRGWSKQTAKFILNSAIEYANKNVLD